MEEEQKKATRRMALFPEKAEVLFIGKDIWVVSRTYNSLLIILLM
jgi:hypothetical protein